LVRFRPYSSAVSAFSVVIAALASYWMPVAHQGTLADSHGKTLINRATNPRPRAGFFATLHAFGLELMTASLWYTKRTSGDIPTQRKSTPGWKQGLSIFIYLRLASRL